MNISKTKTRAVVFYAADEAFVLEERVLYVPPGYTRGKWSSESVVLTRQEAEILQAELGKTLEK